MDIRDYYESKMVMGVIEKTIPLRTFFKHRFFNNTVTFPTERVMFEFQENRRRLAPYVNPNLGSESIARDEYDVRDYATPYISPKRVITNDTDRKSTRLNSSHNLEARRVHVRSCPTGRQACNQGQGS